MRMINLLQFTDGAAHIAKLRRTVAACPDGFVALIDRWHIKISFVAHDLVHELDAERFSVVTEENLGPFEPPRGPIASEAPSCA